MSRRKSERERGKSDDDFEKRARENFEKLDESESFWTSNNNENSKKKMTQKTSAVMCALLNKYMRAEFRRHPVPIFDIR